MRQDRTRPRPMLSFPLPEELQGLSADAKALHGTVNRLAMRAADFLFQSEGMTAADIATRLQENPTMVDRALLELVAAGVAHRITRGKAPTVTTYFPIPRELWPSAVPL